MKLRNGEAIKIFMAMLSTAVEGKCLLWPHGSSGNGYGALHIDAKKVYVHRLAWEVKFGPIPTGMQVLHRCDNPPCFNPFCLFLGTTLDNQRDSQNKGRTCIGTKNAQARLTDADVVKLRSLYRRGVKGFGCIALSQRFGVSHSTVRKAIKGVTWKHI